MGLIENDSIPMKTKTSNFESICLCGGTSKFGNQDLVCGDYHIVPLQVLEAFCALWSVVNTNAKSMRGFDFLLDL
jgi:hypothetical protein